MAKKTTKNPFDDLKGIRLEDLYSKDSKEYTLLNNIANTGVNSIRSQNPYINTLQGTTGMGLTIPQQPDFGESIHDNPYPTLEEYLDYQEFRAQRQSGFEQIVNGILKGLTTTATTFANVLGGIPYGVFTAIDEGRLSGIWDNAVTNAIDDVDDWVEKELPNYYTREELNSPWYTNIFSANFLGDKLIKNFGFSFGAAAAGKIIAKLPKFLPKIAGKVGKAVGKSTRDIGAIERATNTFETGLVSAIGEGSIEALDATKEWSAAMTNKINQEQSLKLYALQQEYQEGLANIQQQYGNTEIYEQLVLSYQNEIQQKARAIEDETNQKMAQVASQRAQLGNEVLAFNIPILTLSNIALLGRVYAGGWTAEQQSMKRFISSNLDELPIAGKTTTKTARNLLGKPVEKEIVHNVYENNLTLARNIMRGGKQAVGEGLEEMEQLIASNAAKDYNNDYFANATDPDATENTANMWGSLWKQFGETLGDFGNWEEFFIGMLSGGISNIALGANKGLRRERQEAQELVDMLNDRVNNFNSRNMIQGLNRHGRYGDQMVEAAIRGDKKDYKDAEFAQTVSDVIMWAEAGKLDDLKKIVDYNLDNNLSDEELEQIAEALSQKDKDGGEHNRIAAASNEDRRKYIQSQKDKYHKVIDRYTEERDNLVSNVGSIFDREELSELTYLRMRAQDSAERSTVLQNKLLQKLNALQSRNTAEQATARLDFLDAKHLKTILSNRLKSDQELLEQLYNQKTGNEGINLIRKSLGYDTRQIKSLEKRIEQTKKLLAKDFSKAVSNEAQIAYLSELMGIQSENNKTYSSAIDFINDNFKEFINLNANSLQAGNVIKVAENVNGLIDILSSIKSTETTNKELSTTIEDAIRLVEDANRYNQKLNEYINKPEKLREKNQGLIEKARNRKLEKEADKVEEDIANTKNFNEFSRKLDNLDPRVKSKVLKRLKDKQNKNALEYENKSQKISLVLSYITASNEEPRIKQLSTALFMNAAKTLSEDDLFNIDSNIYSRENNKQLDDATYIKVKTLLAEAFKFQADETSEPTQEDTINIKDAPKATEKSDKQKKEDTKNSETYWEDLGEENAKYEEDLANQDLTSSEREEGVESTGETHPFSAEFLGEVDFKKVENSSPVALVNIDNNNLTEKNVQVDEKVAITNENNQPITQHETKNDDVMGMQEIDTKSGSINFGKPAIEEVDNEGNLTQQAKNSKLLYDKLEELGAFENVDNGVVKKGSRVYFGLIPSLDTKIKEQNNYDGTTILLFVDGKCVGHLAPRSKSHAKLIPLLKEEFKGKLNTSDILISNRYYTIADDIWSGIVRYNNQDYRNLTNEDLNWTKERINSSVTSQEDQTPLFTIFDGSTGFRKDASTIFKYGDKIAPVYIDNPLYKGVPVLLIPTGAYDRNKSNTEQDSKAFIPVALRRTLFNNLKEDSTTNTEIVETIDRLFKTINVKQLNEIIGDLKKNLTYEFNTNEGKQQIFIVPARVSAESGNIIEMRSNMFASADTKFEDASVTHLIIQHKVDGKTISTYTVGIAQGTFHQTQELPKETQQANREAFIDFLKNEAKSYVNINQNRLNEPEYIQQILDDELLQTNAKELKVLGNSFHMSGEIFDANVITETKPQEIVAEQVAQEQITSTTQTTTNPLLDILGANYDSTKQADTEGQERYSRITPETSLGTIDVEKEIDNILRVLPQLNRDEAFEIIDGLKTINDRGDQAQGIFNAGLMTLSRIAESGTGYHEAFHLVFNMILSEQEKADLLEEYKIKNPTLDYIDLEEQMAEDFKEFALLNENNISTTNWIQRLGQKVYNAFKKLANYLHLYKYQPITFNKVCSDIWQGKYAGKKLHTTNEIRYKINLSKEQKIVKAGLTNKEYEEIAKVVKQINKDYKKEHQGIAIKFEFKGPFINFFLTDDTKLVSTVGYNKVFNKEYAKAKDFIEKYLKNNNLEGKYEVIRNHRGDYIFTKKYSFEIEEGYNTNYNIFDTESVCG